MLSTIIHNSWLCGRVNLIFSPDITDGMNQIRTIFVCYQQPELHSVVLNVFFHVWESIGE